MHIHQYEYEAASLNFCEADFRKSPPSGSKQRTFLQMRVSITINCFLVYWFLSGGQGEEGHVQERQEREEDVLL